MSVKQVSIHVMRMRCVTITWDHTTAPAVLGTLEMDKRVSVIVKFLLIGRYYFLIVFTKRCKKRKKKKKKKNVPTLLSSLLFLFLDNVMISPMSELYFASFYMFMFLQIITN